MMAWMFNDDSGRGGKMERPARGRKNGPSLPLHYNARSPNYFRHFANYALAISPFMQNNIRRRLQGNIPDISAAAALIILPALLEKMAREAFPHFRGIDL
jgi:hypothetical protein